MRCERKHAGHGAWASCGLSGDCSDGDGRRSWRDHEGSRSVFEGRNMATTTDEYEEIDVAPVPELVRYLGILHRALITIRNHGVNQETGEAQFCGHLADVLHNLPDLLLCYGAFDQEEFWREVRGYGANVPPEFARNWAYIFGEIKKPIE
jgi:hypothetical protein